LQSFDYVSPTQVNEVVALLADGRGPVKLLCGGTDLLVQLREGRAAARLVVDVKQIPELTRISYDPDQGLYLGAAASCACITHHPDVARYYPGLVDAVTLIGGVQIQNRASVGGNLCNASPAADAIPALIVHRAVCQIAGPNGTRQALVEEFCTAPGKNILQPGELLVSLSLPPPPDHFGAAYLRFIPRNEMDIAVVGAAAAVTLDESGEHFAAARVALGAVAPTPLFVPEAGASLVGQLVNETSIAGAARLAQEAARPISDLRGSAEQRRHLSGVLARRALEIAVSRAQSSLRNTQ